MKYLKTFIDSQGERVQRGADVPDGRYDKNTIRHYERLGMVGNATPGQSRPAKKPRATPKPAETKPAAPGETKVDGGIDADDEQQDDAQDGDAKADSGEA